jgi:hypothetical protein
MNERNPPEGAADDGPLSFNEGVDAITNLFDGSDENPDEADEDVAEGDDSEDPEAETEGDEDEAGGDEEDADEEDGPDEYAGGRFASDNAKVTLKDGSTISVQELKRGFLAQQAFTRNSQELARERDAFRAEQEQVNATAQQIAAQRDFLLQVAQRFLPSPPDRSLMESDPYGYMQAKQDYEERVAALQHMNTLSQADRQRMEQEQARAQQAFVRQEQEALLQAMPELQSPDTYRQFWTDTVQTMADFGFSEDEIANVTDHRIYKVFRALSKFQKAQKAAPSVKEQVRGKPVMTGKKRMDPKAKLSREKQGASERLRKTGTFEAGVEALMNFDL